MTILLDASMDGFKLKPLVIGKTARPRALASYDLNKLPVHYWMTTDILEHCFIFHIQEKFQIKTISIKIKFT